MSEENTFSVKSPSMCQRLTFGTYPTFLEFTTVCLEKWCLFEDKEQYDWYPQEKKSK